MPPTKPGDPTPSSLVDDAPANKPKTKKKKKAPNSKATYKADAKYAAPTKQDSDVTRVSVKPSGVANIPDLARQGSGSARHMAASPTGGYSTGYYRYRHVAQLHRLFQREDDYHSGEITIDEFCHAIRDEKRPLTLGMFAYVGLDATLRRFTFDQFVLCIVTFAALSRKELLHYAFTLFDKDESGIMDMGELRSFYGGLKNKSAFYFQKNVDVAQKKLAEKDHTSPGTRHHAVGAGADGLVDFEDLQEGSSHFQIAFFPLQQFQRNIQVAALGEAFWADVVYKKSQIERIVHYMRLHDGHLPPVPVAQRIAAMARYAIYVLTGGGATTVFNGGPIALRQAAITKYAEEMRQHKLEDEARKAAKEEEKRQWLAAQGMAVAPSGDDGTAPVVAYAAVAKASDHDALTDSDLRHSGTTTKKPTTGDVVHKKKKKAPKKVAAVVNE